VVQDPEAPRLHLKIDEMVAPPTPADVGVGAVDAAHLEFLKQFFLEQVMAVRVCVCVYTCIHTCTHTHTHTHIHPAACKLSQVLSYREFLYHIY
jgi:hypothetical protein